MNHGQLLDDYHPEKDYIYSAIVNYFDDPIMVKIKDVDNYSMYLCKIHCLLNKDYRYIICFVEKDFQPVHTKENLLNLKWVSLQTRTLPDYFETAILHKYKPKREPPFNSEISVTTKEKTQYTYKCKDLPIKVTLLMQDKGTQIYQDKGTLAAALETFYTVITFI